jgi:hypothetical protein
MSGMDEATNLKQAEERKIAANEAFKGGHCSFISSLSLCDQFHEFLLWF